MAIRLRARNVPGNMHAHQRPWRRRDRFLWVRVPNGAIERGVAGRSQRCGRGWFGMEVLDLLAAAPPTSESAEASKPSIEILGIHLTGAAAWAAFVVSLVSVAQAVFAAISWIRRKLIPISLEAWAWDATTDPGNRPATQLRIDVYNNTDQEKHLMRLQAVYDPGRGRGVCRAG